MQSTLLKPLVLLLLLCLAAAADESTLTISNGRGHRPSLASDARGRVHVVYEGYDKVSRVIEIFYLHSDDYGQTWASPVNLSRTPGTSTHPVICLDSGGGVNVAWIDTTSGEHSPDVYFARSTDDGKTWTPALDISRTPGRSSQPALAAGPDGSLHLVWCDTSSGEKSPDVWYANSSDHGKNWTPGVDLSRTPGVSSQPAVAVGPDGTAHVVWIDTTSGEASPDVYYVCGRQGKFGAIVDVSKTPAVSSQPHVAAAGKNVYVAWIDSSLNKAAPDVFMSSKIGQGPFSAAVDISKTPGVSSDPAIAADAQGRVAVVWVDNYAARKPDVYVASSQDWGTTFASPVNLSKARENTQSPDVSLAGRSIVAVWEELVDGQTVLKLTTLRPRSQP